MDEVEDEEEDEEEEDDLEDGVGDVEVEANKQQKIFQNILGRKSTRLRRLETLSETCWSCQIEATRTLVD
eukprot:12026666-Ditylum_brightwellii.AAC.1